MQYIHFMARNRHDLGFQLYSASLSLTENLTKLYLFSNAECALEWKEEVWNLAHRLPKLKNSNKYPKVKFLVEKLSAYTDVCDSLIESTCEEYKNYIPSRADSSELEAMLNQYFWWLAEELSEHGMIPADKVYNKLDEIGF